MDLRRAARTALVAPLLVASGALALTLGSLNVLAASSPVSSNSVSHVTSVAAAPQSSSKPHKHERVECSPGHVAEDNGQCSVVFVDPKTKGEPSPVGQKVCFTVSPSKAGEVGTGASHCAIVGSNHKALGTFMASGKYCGKAVVTATEAHEKVSHHTTITIVCKPGATTTAAMVPAGSPQPPATGGLLLGAMGVGAALVTTFALLRHRRYAPRRLKAGQPA